MFRKALWFYSSYPCKQNFKSRSLPANTYSSFYHLCSHFAYIMPIKLVVVQPACYCFFVIFSGFGMKTDVKLTCSSGADSVTYNQAKDAELIVSASSY